MFSKYTIEATGETGDFAFHYQYKDNALEFFGYASSIEIAQQIIFASESYVKAGA